MAISTRATITSANLQEWLNRKTLEVFEPMLYFYKMGQKPTVPGGYNTLRWSKFNKINAAQIVALSEGISPTPIAFDASTVSTSPTQYGVTVTISDMLINDSVLNWLQGAAAAVGDALARSIDSTIQTAVMGGTNTLYPGTVATRATLGAANTMTAALLNNAQTFLKAKAAPTFDTGYVSIMHPNVVYDLRAETGTGSWLDANKYATPEKIFRGEIGMIHGVRVVESPWVQTFASTVTVYPTLVLGQGAYGVGDFQTLKTFLTPATPTDSDPLVQRRTVGAKVAFGSIILQQDAMIRIETSSTLAYGFTG